MFTKKQDLQKQKQNGRIYNETIKNQIKLSRLRYASKRS